MKVLFQKIGKFIEGLHTWVKVVSSLIVISSTIYGGILWHDARVIKKYDDKNKIIAKDKDMKDVKFKVDTLYIVFQKYIASQSKFNKLIDTNLHILNTTINIVGTQLGNHIITTAKDKQEIKDWVNAWEKKNEFLTPFLQK